MKGRFLLLAAGVFVLSPFQAFAGFDADPNNPATSQRSISMSGAPAASAELPLPGKIKKASRPPSDPNAPALQTFNERYVPDSIRKKYNLDDSWYGNQGAGEAITWEAAPEPFGEIDPMAPQPAAQPVALTAQPAVQPQVMPQTPVNNAPMRWQAREGMPLQDVLRGWTTTAGAAFVWEAKGGFPLKGGIDQTGSLENALARALKQYDNDQLRPVGTLYVDPATGRKVLVVRNTSS